MPQVISKLRQKITEFWGNLDKSQKSRIYITAGILIAAIIAGTVLLTRTTYVPLITSQDTQEISEMAKLLDENKFSFKLSNDNRSILVSSKEKDKAQALLVQNDYPKSVDAIFDDAFTKIKINSTQDDKRKLWENQQERSIAAKLKMLPGIENATVDLALPEPSVFLVDGQEAQKPTASVMVNPKGKLTAKQVQGVVMMVSRSVEGLEAQNVTVVDYDLNILSTDQSSEDVAQASNQYEMQQLVKTSMEKDVYALLNGPYDSFDNIRVVANPVLDFDKLKSQTQDVANPTGQDGGALISNKETKEDLKNGQVAGEPGMGTNPGDTNAPSYQTGTSGDSSYKKETKEQNFDYKRVMTEEEKALGGVVSDKTTMAIILGYGRRVADDTGMTPEFITQIVDIASKATGIPVANITVNKLKMAQEDQPVTSTMDLIKALIRDYGLFALMLLLIVALLILAIPRKKSVLAQQAIMEAQTAAASPRFVVPEPNGEPIPEIGTEERSEVKKQIDKFVRQKPEAVAQLLRNWIADDWET